MPFFDKLNPALNTLPVYQPGRPIEEVARELGLDPGEIIKVASNENPLGPSPLAVEAMKTAVDEAKGKVRVLVSFFGRETPVELDFLQVERI